MSKDPTGDDGAGERRRRSPLIEIAALFMASRLALLSVGVLAAGLMGSGLPLQRNLVYHEPAPVAFDIWARWDSEWYLLIAAEGYRASEHFIDSPMGYEPEATAGFFPLYPFLIRAITPVLGPVGAGIVISNGCLFFSMVLLHRLVRRERPDRRGRHAALGACGALLLFPTSLFLSAVYAESLFLLLALAVFDRLRAGRFGLAGLLGALAALARPAGLFLVIPIGVEWWIQRHESSMTHQTRSWGWIAVLGPPAGLGIYMMMCWRLFGDPIAFIHRQQRWRGATSGPWRAFVRWWQETPALHGGHDSTLELVIALGCLLALPFLFRSLRLSYALFAGALILFPLCSTLWSFGRLALGAFPLFILMGMGWTGRMRGLAVLYAGISGGVGFFLMALYANWWWAG